MTHLKNQKNTLMDKTTLLIPTLNSEQYLDKTLNSLKDNKNSIYKIFVIDAGSTDNTTNIIKQKKN